VWVASEQKLDGAYQLVFEPPPDVLAAPLRNDAAGRRERFLKKREETGFAAKAGALEAAVKTRLHGFALDGTPVAARLEAFAGLEFPVQRDHCYALLLRLGAGAAFSEVARRGLQTSLDLPGGSRAENFEFSVHGPGGLSREVCVDAAGDARFNVATQLASAAHELGTGPVSLEIWSHPNGPFAETAAARDRAIARETRGYAVAKTLQAQMESFKGLELPLRRGVCYAMAVRLQNGAAFSAEVRASRTVSFLLDTEGQSINGGPGAVGPGGVAQLGCPQRSQKGTFRLGERGPLGKGLMIVQILTRPIGEAALRRQAAEDRADRAESNRNMARMKREACQSCVEEKISCHHRGGASCYDDFLTCVRSKGYAESACGG
jgi:hypothetical protein